MTTTFTPGPWRIVDREVMEDGSVYPCHILGGSDDFQVCALESPQIAKLGVEQPHRFPGLNGVLGPNARLIAAAPDLLEALDTVVFWYGKRGPDDNLLPIDRQEDDIAKAMRAIAKAKGEQQ